MNRTQCMRESHVIRVGPPSHRMPAPVELPRSLSTARESLPRARGRASRIRSGVRVEAEMRMHGGVFGLGSPVGCAQGGDEPGEGVVQHVRESGVWCGL